MKDTVKVIKSLEKLGLLKKGISKIVKNEAKEQYGGVHGMLLGTLGSNLFGNFLAGKGVTRVGEGTIRTGRDFYYLYIL